MFGLLWTGPTSRAYCETVYPRKDALTGSPEMNEITNESLANIFVNVKINFLKFSFLRILSTKSSHRLVENNSKTFAEFRKDIDNEHEK
jgi:hypothetical protein